MGKELTWVQVFRKGLAPQISSRALLALYRGLTGNDTRIQQRLVVDPVPIYHLADCAPRQVCPLGFAAWQSGCGTAGEVLDFFETLCCRCDRHLKHADVHERFLTWVDILPRGVVFRQLAREVRRVLAGRRKRARERRKAVVA